MNRVAGDLGGHPAFDALARMRDAAKDFLRTPLWTTSDTELDELIAETHGRDRASRAGAPSTQAWLRHSSR